MSVKTRVFGVLRCKGASAMMPVCLHRTLRPTGAGVLPGQQGPRRPGGARGFCFQRIKKLSGRSFT